MKKNNFCSLFLFCISFNAFLANSTELISPKEAKLPEANGSLKTRGITRGPAIKVNTRSSSRCLIGYTC